MLRFKLKLLTEFKNDRRAYVRGKTDFSKETLYLINESLKNKNPLIHHKMNKECLECGEKIVGRTDKKFCSDACRNSYNNTINKDSKNLIRNTNNRLRKNYRILEELNPDQKTKVSRGKLIEKGFDFNYFTSIYTTKAGTIYYFLYDQGYLPIDGDYYALVKRES